MSDFIALLHGVLQKKLFGAKSPPNGGLGGK
jgi:hypothetical protein